MKILVLQLARLGDIYMSWPALRALRRAHPTAQIHLLTRPRFEAATHGLEAVDCHKSLPTADLVEPFVREQPADHEALSRMGFYLENLRREHYDWIINLSFSPLSSWLARAAAWPDCRITGYTRHEDGWLCIPDDVSAYFHAQVGIGRSNRLHLCDLFATLVDVDLIEEDWRPTVSPLKAEVSLPDSYIVLHLGASEGRKRLPVFHWARILKSFSEKAPGVSVVLIGSEAENDLAQELISQSPSVPTINLLGKTSVGDLFAVLSGAQALAGADSAPMHIASLTKTPCFNISFPTVNFWETGPRAPRSFVLRLTGAEDLSSGEAGEALALIARGEDPAALVRHTGRIPSYEIPQESPSQRFTWELIQALYLGGTFPVTDDAQFVEGVEKINDMNRVIIEQLQTLPTNSEYLGPLLERGDEVLETIGRLVPACGVFTRWVQTEKTRIGPGSREKIRTEMLRIHELLARVLRVYSLDETAERGT